MTKFNLKASIVESLKDGVKHSSFKEALITRDNTHAIHKDETEYWDYKEDIDLNNQSDIALLAKRVLAFHNANGGVIIFGINKQYNVSGFHASKVVDTVTLKNKLRKYLGEDVTVFQDQIAIPLDRKVIWLLFIKKRLYSPAHILTDGPIKDGKNIIKKGEFYIRVGDEVLLCSEPQHFARLFKGVEFKNLNAYQPEVDIPYFKLLAPHHKKLYGRDDLINEVVKILNGRSYIISLDGVGGVGKSALAIELVSKLYKAKQYDFIISVSAKNKVWHGKTETRMPGFSGLTELLIEISKVLDLSTDGKSVEDIKKQVIDLMQGCRGLLFIDNIEEIQDEAVFKFLRDEVPEPVKVLVTSRISRTLGARVIPVPEIDDISAKALFIEELEEYDYYDYINEDEYIKQILDVTGKLPLAIKWAASLITSNKSLKNVSSKFRKMDLEKQEFLSFCFSTMFEELSPLAKDIAQLCPYLVSDWNNITISIILDEQVSSINLALRELEERGIILSLKNDTSESFFVLPLTMDFLSHKFSQNQNLRRKVNANLALFISSDKNGSDLLQLSNELRIQALYDEAKRFENNNVELYKAEKFINLAIHYVSEESSKIKASDLTKLIFLQGKIVYRIHSRLEGISIMTNAIKNNSLNSDLSSDDYIFLAQAIFQHGEKSKEDLALELFIKHFDKSSNAEKNSFDEFWQKSHSKLDYNLIREIATRINKPSYAKWFLDGVDLTVENNQILFQIGEPVVRVFKLAANNKDVEEQAKSRYMELAGKFEHLFKKA